MLFCLCPSTLIYFSLNHQPCLICLARGERWLQLSGSKTQRGQMTEQTVSGLGSRRGDTRLIIFLFRANAPGKSRNPSSSYGNRVGQTQFLPCYNDQKGKLEYKPAVLRLKIDFVLHPNSWLRGWINFDRDEPIHRHPQEKQFRRKSLNFNQLWIA